MKVLVAADGSKYGQWGLNWVAKLSFVKPPRLTALHVLDRAWLRGPFWMRPEILRMKGHSARTLQEGQAAADVAETQGHGLQEQGMIAPVILKHAPKRDGLMVMGSQGLGALDRFLLGSVSSGWCNMRPVPCSSFDDKPRITGSPRQYYS